MIAAAAPPPAASTAVEPNCAAPANTKADITIAASGPITGRATTPNDRPSSKRRGAERQPGAECRRGWWRDARSSRRTWRERLFGGYARRAVATTLDELIAAARVLDLSHPLTPEFPLFPVYNPVEVAERFTVPKDGFFVRAWSFDEHCGTHVDAPAHFGEGARRSMRSTRPSCSSRPPSWTSASGRPATTTRSWSPTTCWPGSRGTARCPTAAPSSP